MRRLLIVPLLAAACATAPAAPKFSLSRGTKVGYVVELGAHPVHAHVGTTAFNNYRQVADADWRLGEQLRQALAAQLERAGFTPVDLGARGVAAADAASLLVATDRGWKPSPGREEILRRLVQDEGLQAVAVVVPARPFPVGTGLAMDGYGLLSDSVLMLTDCWAVPGMDARLYVLEPLADLSSTGLLGSLVSEQHQRIELKGYKAPADLKAITEAEWQPVRAAIELRARHIAAAIADRLAQG